MGAVMNIIDAHAYIFDHIGSMGKAGELRPLGNGNCRWATGEEFRIIPEGYGDKEFLGETLLKIMDENHVEKAILLQGVSYGLQNEYVLETAAAHPDRFKGAVMLGPFCRCADEILDQFITDLHAKVFKFELSVGGGLSGHHKDFSIDGPIMMPLYEKIAAVPEATLTLDIGSPSMSSCQTEAIDRLAERFPNLHIVVCHLLAPTRDDGHHLACALPYLAHDNVWIDLSTLPWNTAPDPYPFPTALSYIRLAKEILGTRKIMWETDAPCVLTKFSYKELYTYLMESDVFNEHELEDVFYNNAVEAYYL